MKTKTKKKPKTANKIHLFRIKYNFGKDCSVTNSYHYFHAESADQALNFHNFSMSKKGYDCQILSIDKKNPYSNKWENQTNFYINDDEN